MGSVCQMTIKNVFQVEQTHGQTPGKVKREARNVVLLQ